MIRYRKALAKRPRTDGPADEDVEMGDMPLPAVLNELVKVFGLGPLPEGPLVGTPSPSSSLSFSL